MHSSSSSHRPSKAAWYKQMSRASFLMYIIFMDWFQNTVDPDWIIDNFLAGMQNLFSFQMCKKYKSCRNWNACALRKNVICLNVNLVDLLSSSYAFKRLLFSPDPHSYRHMSMTARWLLPNPEELCGESGWEMLSPPSFVIGALQAPPLDVEPRNQYGTNHPCPYGSWL